MLSVPKLQSRIYWTDVAGRGSPVAWSVEAHDASKVGIIDVDVERAQQLAEDDDILGREGDTFSASTGAFGRHC